MQSRDSDLRHCITEIKSRFGSDEHVAATLARQLSQSGALIDSSGLDTADIASTGGPSSLTTLICPLLLRAAGLCVPKLAVPGRPAGGIDCLAQIRGFRFRLSPSEVTSALKSSGYAHFIASDDLAPLDAKMFRIRQEIGAQDVPTLVTARLLSKKIAVGVKLAGLDVRVGPHGNFGATWDSARANAQLFTRTAALLGIRSFPVLTDARFPLQPYLGRRESLVALSDVFADRCCKWLQDHLHICQILAAACLSNRERSKMFGTPHSSLRKHFAQNLHNQGSSLSEFEQLVESTRNQHSITLRARGQGFCQFPLGKLRDVIVRSQKRCESTALFPDPVGLIFLQRPGTWTEAGNPIATVRVDATVSEETVEEICQLICNPVDLSTGIGFEVAYD